MMKSGEIYRSVNRTFSASLFVMIIEEDDQTELQFKAVVLLDLSNEYKMGFTANNWNKTNFERTEMIVVYNLWKTLNYEEFK